MHVCIAIKHRRDQHSPNGRHLDGMRVVPKGSGAVWMDMHKGQGHRRAEGGLSCHSRERSNRDEIWPTSAPLSVTFVISYWPPSIQEGAAVRGVPTWTKLMGGGNSNQGLFRERRCHDCTQVPAHTHDRCKGSCRASVGRIPQYLHPESQRLDSDLL